MNVRYTRLLLLPMVATFVVTSSVVAKKAGAQDADFAFAGAMSGTSYDWAQGIATDGAGNAYTTGFFHESFDLDPGPGVDNHSAAGSSDIFVQKLDPSGNFVWGHAFGSTGQDEGRAIAADSAGNVYVTGFFKGTIDFDPGPGVTNLVNGGDGDIFILKLDPFGNLCWAYAFGSTTFERGTGITVDDAGNVYATGNFRGIVDFDPSAVAAYPIDAPNGAAFVLKLDTSGEFIWAGAFLGSGSGGVDLALDTLSDVYVLGGFMGNVDFDPGPGVFTVDAGNRRKFVAKLSSQGSFRWVRRFGGDSASGIAVDGLNNVITTGLFYGSLDFDPGSGAAIVVSSGDLDAYVTKWSSNGVLLWARAFGGTRRDEAYAVAADESGNIYVTGMFQEVVDFDRTLRNQYRASAGNLDTWVTMISRRGEVLWVAAMGGTSGDQSRAIAVDESGFVYIAGEFISTVDFDPSPGITLLVSTGQSQDAFVSKFRPILAPLPPLSSLNVPLFEVRESNRR